MQTDSERPRGKSLGPLRTLIPFLSPYRGTLIAALSALLIASGAMLALPIALRYLIDNGFIARDVGTVIAILAGFWQRPWFSVLLRLCVITW
jgi:ATP-binding cassette subfamily B protein